jgi:hypothetical protein
MIITRAPFAFLPEQEAIFKARWGEPPSEEDLKALKGPAFPVNLRHRPPHGRDAITIPPTVAFIDTGMDSTRVDLDFVLETFKAAGQRSPLHYWRPHSKGFETSHFVIEINGVALPTRSGNIFLCPRRDMPGYERVLIGRDVLNQMTLCCGTDTFSLIGPAQTSIRVSRNDPRTDAKADAKADPCCR